MSAAILLKFSASSLISSAPRATDLWWNSPRLMARVDAASPRIGPLMPTAKKYPTTMAASTTMLANTSACRFNSSTPVSLSAASRRRCAITAQFSSGNVL
jgi:hypothetical protein